MAHTKPTKGEEQKIRFNKLIKPASFENQTNGEQKTQIVDSDGNIITATSNALDVNIKSGIELEVDLDFATDTVDVTGSTITANAGTNLNTSLLALETTNTSIKDAVQIIDNFISGSRGLVTEDNSAAIKTAVELIDNAIAGSEMQVDIVGALPSGTNTIGAINQTTGQGKTLLFGTIAQAAAGTTQLVAADATKKIKLVSYVFVISLAGTIKFTGGAADLTGVMTISANGGVSAIGQPSSHLFETPTNSALSIVTTVGAANGHFSYFLEA